MEFADLLDELPADRRLALAYAPAAVRADTLAVLLLDLRLSRLIAQRREPLLTQMRLAWWRDRLKEGASGFHHDEPVLALLAGWGDVKAELAALVDGWEALLTEPPISDGAIAAFADGRAKAFAALAERFEKQSDAAEAHRAGYNWALADLATRTSDPEEVAQVRSLAADRDWRRANLSSRLRPLAVLHGLAARKRGHGELLASMSDGLAAMRLGLFGR